MTRISGKQDFQPHPLKLLFQTNGVWADLLETCPFRETEVEVITKMLACGTPLTGSKEFHCDNPDCSHRRLIHQSCKGRGCPSCGKKSTDMWIATMMARLPDTRCQHGTFTIPDTLWPVFEVNRWRLTTCCMQQSCGGCPPVSSEPCTPTVGSLTGIAISICRGRQAVSVSTATGRR